MLDASPAFSLDTYRRHILDQLPWSPVLFSALFPVIPDHRRDRVRRFVALIFMQQAGEVELTQGDEDIWVQRMHHETDDQG
jgi:chromatin segregation and condensation protein Rec8/ScpA/Scc1 (kleisin family)